MGRAGQLTWAPLAAALLLLLAAGGATGSPVAPGFEQRGQGMTWNAAVDHCEAKGRRLCVASEVCAAGAAADGEAFAPVGNGHNKWVFVGKDEARRTKCEIKDRPAWGNSPQSSAHRGSLLCCDFKLDKIKETATWQEAHDHCAKKNMQLCDKSDYCDIRGKDGSPKFGVLHLAQWAAIRGSNQWVSIGHAFPGIALCKTHQEVARKDPEWGKTSAARPRRGAVMCCPRAGAAASAAAGAAPAAAAKTTAANASAASKTAGANARAAPKPAAASSTAAQTATGAARPAQHRHRPHFKMPHFTPSPAAVQRVRQLKQQQQRAVKVAVAAAAVATAAALRKATPPARTKANRVAVAAQRHLQHDLKKMRDAKAAFRNKVAASRLAGIIRGEARSAHDAKRDWDYIRQLRKATKELEPQLQRAVAAAARVLEQARAKQAKEQAMAARQAAGPWLTAEVYPVHGERVRERHRRQDKGRSDQPKQKERGLLGTVLHHAKEVGGKFLKDLFTPKKGADAKLNLPGSVLKGTPREELLTFTDSR